MLDAATREAAAELATRTKLPPERLVLGGRSMGGRYCSLVAGDADDPVPALGLAAARLSAARRGQARDSRASSTSRGIRMPVLFVSGTRDSLRAQAELTKAAQGGEGHGRRSTGSRPPTTASGR